MHFTLHVKIYCSLKMKGNCFHCFFSPLFSPGLQLSNTALKKHVSELEEALARRESSLVEIQTHFSDNVKERETEERDYIKRIQELEDTLIQEKANQRELRKQVSIFCLK